jgi:hypothetical protein
MGQETHQLRLQMAYTARIHALRVLRQRRARLVLFVQTVQRVRPLEAIPQRTRPLPAQRLDERDRGRGLISRQQQEKLRLKRVGVRGGDPENWTPASAEVREERGDTTRTLVTRLYRIRMVSAVDLRAEGLEKTLELLRDGERCPCLWLGSVCGLCGGRRLGFGCWHRW